MAPSCKHIAAALLAGLCAAFLSGTAPLRAQQFDPPDTDYANGNKAEDPDVLRSLPIEPEFRAYLPVSVDLSYRLPEPGNQGASQSCTAWAAAYAARSYYTSAYEGRDTRDLKNVASPAFVYNLSWRHDKDGKCEAGSRFSSAVAVLNRGAPALADYPFRDSDCSAPPPATIARAGDFRVQGLRRIDQKRIDDVKGALAQSNPVVVSFHDDKAWHKHRGAGVFDRVAIDQETGWHAMAVIGYDDRKRAFRFINSWGKGWGDNGYAWVSYDVFTARVREAETLQVVPTRPAHPVAPPQPPLQQPPNVAQVKPPPTPPAPPRPQPSPTPAQVVTQLQPPRPTLAPPQPAPIRPQPSITEVRPTPAPPMPGPMRPPTVTQVQPAPPAVVPPPPQPAPPQPSITQVRPTPAPLVDVVITPGPMRPPSVTYEQPAPPAVAPAPPQPGPPRPSVVETRPQPRPPVNVTITPGPMLAPADPMSRSARDSDGPPPPGPIAPQPNLAEVRPAPAPAEVTIAPDPTPPPAVKQVQPALAPTVAPAVAPTSVPPARPTLSDLASLTCGRVSPRREGTTNILDGYVGSENDLELVKTIAADEPDTMVGNVLLAPWPQCEAIQTLERPLVTPEKPGIDLGPTESFRADDTLHVTIRSPDQISYLYVSYVQADGSVVHLVQPAGLVPQPTLPHQTLTFGDGHDGGATFTIGPPFGREMIIAIASRSPLFDHALPPQQTEREYLTALRQALVYKPSPELPDRELSASIRTLQTEAR